MMSLSEFIDYKQFAFAMVGAIIIFWDSRRINLSTTSTVLWIILDLILWAVAVPLYFIFRITRFLIEDSNIKQSKRLNRILVIVPVASIILNLGSLYFFKNLDLGAVYFILGIFIVPFFILPVGFGVKQMESGSKSRKILAIVVIWSSIIFTPLLSFGSMSLIFRFLSLFK